MARKLSIDRSLCCTNFGGWKLSSCDDAPHKQARLPGCIRVPMSGGSGFLQTKTVVSCNHIHQLSSGSYIFLAAAEGEAQSIYRLSLSDGDSLSVGIDPVAGTIQNRALLHHAWAADVKAFRRLMVGQGKQCAQLNAWSLHPEWI
jgi:hypothetical protein